MCLLSTWLPATTQVINRRIQSCLHFWSKLQCFLWATRGSAKLLGTRKKRIFKTKLKWELACSPESNNSLKNPFFLPYLQLQLKLCEEILRDIICLVLEPDWTGQRPEVKGTVCTKSKFAHEICRCYIIIMLCYNIIRLPILFILIQHLNFE